MKVMSHAVLKITILLLGTSILMFGCSPQYKPEDAFATEERHNSTFSVRVTAYRERRDFAQALGGAYYVFEAKNRDEGIWKKFLVVADDDPEPIDKNSIVIVNEKTGYGFMLKRFAVTTDAGKTWSIWDVGKVDSLKADRSCRIQSVKLNEFGTGNMGIICSNSSTVLSTKDFGVTWKE